MLPMMNTDLISERKYRKRQADEEMEAMEKGRQRGVSATSMNNQKGVKEE